MFIKLEVLVSQRMYENHALHEPNDDYIRFKDIGKKYITLFSMNFNTLDECIDYCKRVYASVIEHEKYRFVIYP